MIYTFTCPEHGDQLIHLPIGQHKAPQTCSECGASMERNFLADWKTVHVNTSGCRDHNEVPFHAQVQPHHGHVSKRAAEKLEAAYAQHISEQRKAVRRTPGRLRKTHSMPAELVFGKIRETGDKHYWDDPANRDKHKEFKL